MKNNKRIFKRIAVIFLLFVVLSMWAAADAYAQNKIKYTYDSAGNRLSRQKEIVVQTRGALSDEEEPSVYEEELSETKVTIYPNPTKGVLKVDIQLKLVLIILNLIILIHKTRKILQTIIRGDLPMMFFINLL